MTPPPRLQYTSVRTRVVDGQVRIGVKHTAKDAQGERVKLPWVEMTPEVAADLAAAIQHALIGLEGPKS
jgi:hypothetical protein